MLLRMPSQWASATLPAFPRWLRACFWLCVAIALAVVVRRVATYISPNEHLPDRMASVEAAFANRRALTLAHILPAGAFVLLAPFVLRRGVGRRPRLEMAFYVLGGVIGVTAYAMSGHPVGGNVERSAVLVFDTLYLYTLARSFRLWRGGVYLPANRWLLRAVAILLGIATTRPVMGVFFATSALTHLAPQQFFGIAFWIGFSINAIAMEIWIRRSYRVR